MEKKKKKYCIVLRMNCGASQPEERSCSVVWWCGTSTQSLLSTGTARNIKIKLTCSSFECKPSIMQAFHTFMLDVVQNLFACWHVLSEHSVSGSVCLFKAPGHKKPNYALIGPFWSVMGKVLTTMFTHQLCLCFCDPAWCWGRGWGRWPCGCDITT